MEGTKFYLKHAIEYLESALKLLEEGDRALAAEAIRRGINEAALSRRQILRAWKGSIK